MSTSRGTRGNLPVEVTSFVGRRREPSEVRRLLARSRLVTLTGAGGTGKTRLAVRVGAQRRQAFGDEVWFIDLTQLRGSELRAQNVRDTDVLAFLVAVTLGLRERGGEPLRELVEQLANRRLLLILDNCEHLLPATAILAHRLLRGCPGLRILATSRESLAITGETIFAISPLPAPDPGHLPGLVGLGRYEAVALFLARAQAVVPGFGLTTDNHLAVAELCHQLDGLPLAIELAAARIRTLSPQQVLDHLTDRFALLSLGRPHAPPRQQTLRACVDWSFDLCAKPERILWARLTVFAGAFELDAIEGICADEDLPEADLLDLVAGLVDKSILVRDDVRGAQCEAARYRMLETIRDYGREQLLAAGEEAVLRRRHRDWYQQLVTQAKTQWTSERQEYWMARLDREHPNLRAAVEFCLTGPDRVEAILHTAATLPGLDWWTNGFFDEGHRWLDLALAQVTALSAVRARARTLLLDGHTAIIQNQTDVGLRLLDEGETLARQLDTTVELALAAYIQGHALLNRGDLPAAVAAFERSRDILATQPKPESGLKLELHLNQLIALAMATALVGDHDSVDARLQETLTITQPLGEHRYRSYALWAQALSTWRQGKINETLALLQTSLRLQHTLRSTDRYGTARCLGVMAWAAAGQRQYRRAATLLGAADALWPQRGALTTTYGYLVSYHDACQRQARDALGDAAFQHALHDGQALTYEDAIGYALDERATPSGHGTRTPRLS